MDDQQDASLEQLDGQRWPPPPVDATRLIRTVHELRRVPINRLTVEDLRILLSQKVGVAALTAKTLEVLEADPSPRAISIQATS